MTMARVPLKVAVIGAGIAGLIAARELQREGHQVVVYEKQDQLGGIWVYTKQVEADPLGLDPNREIVHGSLYFSLRTNLPRHLMSFSDFPFTERKYEDLRNFPGHQEVLKYFNDFAMEFGLVELIRLKTEVVRVEQVGPGNELWIVESIFNGLNSEDLFEAVIICNGHYTVPEVADFPGLKTWAGKQVHSHNYRVSEPFRDQVVVVIGDGPSARDISKELTTVAKEVHRSSRSSQVVISKSEIYDNMWQHSNIRTFHDDGTVDFEDGVSVHAEVVLHCTGYKYHVPFLKTNGIVTIEDNRIGPLYKHVFPPKLAPNLSFIGLPYGTIIFAMLELQARWVAHVLSGKVLLPSEEKMLADVEEYYQHMEKSGVPKHDTHCLSFELEYLDWIAMQVGLPGLERQKHIFKELLKMIIANGHQESREWDVDICLGSDETPDAD